MRFERFYNQTTWPVPDLNKDPRLSWKLRYGKPTKEDLLLAASVIEAYEAIVFMTQKRRNIRCQNIKTRSKNGK